VISCNVTLVSCGLEVGEETTLGGEKVNCCHSEWMSLPCGGTNNQFSERRAVAHRSLAAILYIIFFEIFVRFTSYLSDCNQI
jgi:hypothetical protein